MKTLVAIGCSHTAGAELYEGYTDHIESKNRSFAAKVAKNLKMDYINLALNGASNDYIFRTSIKFINDNISNINNYFFLIGWTSAWRYELRYKDEDPYTYIDSKYVPCTPNMAFDNIKDRRMRTVASKYSDVLVEPNMVYDRMATFAWSLQQTFKSLNIDYYMFNTVHLIPCIESNKHIIENIDTDRFYEPQNNAVTFFNHGVDVLKLPVSKYHHLPQAAHDAYAEILTQRLTQ